MVKKISVGSVNVVSYQRSLNAEKYEAMKTALLKVLPKFPEGLTQTQMRDAVAPLVSKDLFHDQGKIDWWCKAVQLDLKKSGKMQRDKKAKPLIWGRA
jgi:hypothetical protein